MLDGWRGHVLVLGLSTTELTDIFHWLVSLIDDNTHPNRQQRRVKFLVNPFSMLAVCIPAGSACCVMYLLHIVCTLFFVKFDWARCVQPSRHKTSSRPLSIVLELSYLEKPFSRYLQDIFIKMTCNRHFQDILILS